MGFTVKALTETIQRTLGRSGRRVELQPEDYLQAIKLTLDRWSMEYPQHGYTVMPTALTNSDGSGVGKYIVDAQNVDGVLDVTFFNNGGKYAYYPYPDQATDQYLVQGQLKEQELIFSDLPEWDAFMEPDPNDANKTKCWIYVHFTSDSFVDRAGRIPNYIAIKYAWHIEATDDPVVGLPRVRNDWKSWIERYATAQARLVMGEIRGKFNGIPGAAAGEVLGIDGDKQIARADAEVLKLEAELVGRARQLPMLID
jgi:hypothetical protein